MNETITITLNLTKDQLGWFMDALGSYQDYCREWIDDGWVDGEDAEVLESRANAAGEVWNQIDKAVYQTDTTD